MTDDATIDAVLTPQEIIELRERNAAHAATLKQNDINYLTDIRTQLLHFFPDVQKFTVSSSDQGHYGYYLYDVTDKYQGLFEGGNAQFDLLDEAVTDSLRDLSWGSFGDKNDDSTFEVDAETMRIIR